MVQALIRLPLAGTSLVTQDAGKGFNHAGGTQFAYDFGLCFGHEVLAVASAGNDRLSRDAGNDVHDGGTGCDTLFGGNGVDVFVFQQGDGIDSLCDFQIGVDRLQLDGLRGFSALVFSAAVGGT